MANNDYKNRRIVEKGVVRKVETLPATQGDGAGNLAVPGKPNYIYAIVGNQVQEVFNNRVPPEQGVRVTVGRDYQDPEQRGIFQVLSTRTGSPGSSANLVGFAPGDYYRWGGQSPLWVELRQIMPLRLGPYSGMTIQLYHGNVWNGTGLLFVTDTTQDMTSYIPAGAGNAALVNVTVNSAGTVVFTKGTEFVMSAVTTFALLYANIPAFASDTVFWSGSVLVYNGQTQVVDGPANTDIIDGRFSGITFGISSSGTITQSGSVTAGHLATWNADHVIEDGGAFPVDIDTNNLADYSAGPHVFTISTDGDNVYGINSNGWHNSPVSSIFLNGKTWEVYGFRNQSSSKLCLAVRTIPGPFVVYVTSVTCSGTDGHYGITVGLDKNGFIHVAYDMHAEALKYRKSTVAIDTFTGTLTSAISMLGTNESSITYPGFFNDPSMELYFIFRDGTALSGDIFLYKYNAATTAWAAATGTTAGKVANGKTNTYSPYFNTPVFDANFGSGGKMHLFWSWYNSGATQYTNLAYVSWDGTNWKQSDGSAQTIPVTTANSDNAQSLGATSVQPSVINQAAASDISGHPHLALGRWDGSSYYMHYLYYSGSSWVDAVVDTQVSAYWTPYPILVFDRMTDTAYVIYTNYGYGDSYVRILRSRPGDFTHWDIAILYPGATSIVGEADYEPKFDVNEWNRTKRIMLSIEPTGTDAGKIFWMEFIPSGWALTDALLYPALHTNDTDATTSAIHHTLGTGADQAAAGNHTHVTTTIGELLMQDGVSSPPVPLTTEDGTDWLYQG